MKTQKLALRSMTVFLTGIIAVGLGYGWFGLGHAKGQATGGYVKTYILEGTTNEHGRFDLPHGINQKGCQPDCYRIWGMTVAFQSNGNKGWYAANALPKLNFRYAWTDTHVNGHIENTPEFTNSKVRVVLFVHERPG